MNSIPKLLKYAAQVNRVHDCQPLIEVKLHGTSETFYAKVIATGDKEVRLEIPTNVRVETFKVSEIQTLRLFEPFAPSSKEET